MKTIVIIAVSIIAFLSIALYDCFLSLQNTNAKLEVRKEVWGKLRFLAGAYAGGINLRIPGDRENTPNKQIIIKHEKWGNQEYIFSLEGTEAHLEQDGKNVNWSQIQDGMIPRW